MAPAPMWTVDAFPRRVQSGARDRMLGAMQSDLFRTPDSPPASEHTETLASFGGARVERIVSWGHASPDGFWYEQDEAEWVAVLAGRARLRFEDPSESVELTAGEHLLIAPHRRHRVEWTLPEKPTVWLAVFSREP